MATRIRMPVILVSLVALCASARPIPTAKTYMYSAGGPFLQISGMTEREESEVFERLGIGDGRVPEGEGYRRGDVDRYGKEQHWDAGFYRLEVDEWFNPDPKDIQGAVHADDGLRRSNLLIGGLELAATISRTDTPSIVVDDSLDGRVEFRNTTMGVKWATDKHGFVIGASYDEFNRATRVLIGLSYILETDYPESQDYDTRWAWTERRLTTRAGKLLGKWRWSENLPEPRPGAKVWAGFGQSFGAGPLVAEWDTELFPEGRAIHTAMNYISIRAPFGVGQVWRSVLLPLQEGHGNRPITMGHLDFTADKFRLWLDLGAHESDREHEQGVVASTVIELTRHEATPELIAAFTKDGAF